MVYFHPPSTLTFKITFQPMLSILHLHAAQTLDFQPHTHTVFRHCLEALWVMHDAAILVSRTLWVFNQPGSAELYCLATAIPVTVSTFITRALEWQSKQENYCSPSGGWCWRAWGAAGYPDAFLTNSPMRKQWVQQGETNKSMEPLIQQLLTRDYLLHPLLSQNWGEECCKKGVARLGGEEDAGSYRRWD